MSEVNTDQDPNDFAAMATNDDPADPEGQPTGQDPGGATPPADPPADPNAPPPEGGTPAPAEPPVTPTPEGGDAPETPEAKPGEEKKPDTPPAPADPEGQPTEPKTPEEIKEQENATQKITELGEARANLFKTTLGLVETNPELIKDIHESDPKLANEIVKEHWGQDSFEDLMAHARVQELKETDPERAKVEQKLLDVQSSNKNILGQLKTTAETAFYKDKGIQNNPYDENYKAIQTALQEVNPALIETNYARALELAHSIAFPGRTDEQIAGDIKKIALATGTGTPVAPGAGSPPAAPSTHSEGQQDFMRMVSAPKTS